MCVVILGSLTAYVSDLLPNPLKVDPGGVRFFWGGGDRVHFC